MRDASRKGVRLVDRFFLWATAASAQVDGLWVGAYFGKGLDRVVSALDLIKVWDPVRYRRLLRDIDRVLINVLLGVSAQYRKDINACELDERFVLSDGASPETIAAAIVHEATHARLEHLGFKYEESRRERLELICIRRELAFVARLPTGKAAREWIELTQKNLSNFDLTNAGFAERRPGAEREVLKYLGLSDRGVRVAVTLGNLISAPRLLYHRVLRLWCRSGVI
jgi:hypothetical protein